MALAPFAAPMKRPRLTLIAVSVAGACCVLALVISASYHQRRLDDVQKRLEWLEGHKPCKTVALRVWGAISTTDQSPDQSSLIDMGPYTNGHTVFQPAAKSGPVIGPEFRIPVGSTNCQVFDIAIAPGIDNVIEAWVSDITPCEAMASFEEFRVYASHGHRTFLNLIAKVKPQASIKMRFTLVLLCEKQVQ